MFRNINNKGGEGLDSFGKPKEPASAKPIFSNLGPSLFGQSSSTSRANLFTNSKVATGQEPVPAFSMESNKPVNTASSAESRPAHNPFHSRPIQPAFVSPFAQQAKATNLYAKSQATRLNQLTRPKEASPFNSFTANGQTSG